MSTSTGQGLRVKAKGHPARALDKRDGSLRFTSWSGTKFFVEESLEPCEHVDKFCKEYPTDAGHLIISEDVRFYEDDDPEVSRITSGHHKSRAHWNAITDNVYIAEHILHPGQCNYG